MWPTNVKEDKEISDAFRHLLKGVPVEVVVEDACSALPLDGEAVESTNGDGLRMRPETERPSLTATHSLPPRSLSARCN